MSVSERAREGGGERRVVIAGERRCVGVTRRACEYASRQCKIVYGPCWRNRHRSAPARSGYGHHVKCGSCDMPLRSAKSRPGQHRSGGRAWSVEDQGWCVCVSTTGVVRRGASAVAAVCRGEARGRSGCLLLACVCAWPKANPRERSNNSTREWNGLEQAMDGVVSHAEQVVGVCSCNTGRARRRAAAAAATALM